SVDWLGSPRRTLPSDSYGFSLLLGWALPFPPRLGEVEAIKVHHLGPRRHEVFHKLLLRVRARIDFREGAQLRVRAEDQVDTGAGPLDFARRAIAPLVHAFGAGGRLPLRAHVEKVDEEVVRQRF